MLPASHSILFLALSLALCRPVLPDTHSVPFAAPGNRPAYASSPCSERPVKYERSTLAFPQDW